MTSVHVSVIDLCNDVVLTAPVSCAKPAQGYRIQRGLEYVPCAFVARK